MYNHQANIRLCSGSANNLAYAYEVSFLLSLE